MKLDAPRRRALGSTFALALAACATSAWGAVPKSQCIDADGQGQSLRIDGKLTSARLQLEICSDPSCPALVRSDCAQRLVELERVQPTIVFDVTDDAGANVPGAHLRIDGEPTDLVQGEPLRVDPGEHEFLFSADGKPPVTRKIVVKEGEKDRHEHVLLAAPPAPPPKPVVPIAAPLTPPPRVEANGSLGTRKILGLAAGGAGVAGVAAGAVFGALTIAAANRQKAECASPLECTNHGGALSDHSTAQTDGAVSTAAFVAGGALVAIGAWLFFGAPPHAEPGDALAPERSAAADRGRWRFELVATPAGGGISLRTEL